MLKPGVWRYQKGKHKRNSPFGYMAFVQAAPVTVVRDQKGEDTGFFGINIHAGGIGTTSSLGCQTVYKLQWLEFRSLVYAEMAKANVTKIPYVLVTEEERRQIAST